MDASSTTLTPHRRAVLADRGRRLYGKYCGTRGRGICAESFAVYHISRGECIVAEDLLAFLESQVANLITADPHGQLTMTRGLIERLRRALAALGDMPQTGPALRQFVIDRCDG